MSGLAALVVKQAAVASGFGMSLVPGIGPSAVDGFAAGTLLCGLCLMLVIRPRRGLRRTKSPAGDGALTMAQHNPMTPGLSSYVAASACAVPASAYDPFDESAEMVVSYPVRQAGGQLPDVKNGRSRSKHRSPGRDVAEWRPEVRRSPGRHAAQRVSRTSRVARKLALHPLPVRH
jgi:hypothetical protein